MKRLLIFLSLNKKEESFTVSGEDLLKKVKELIKEGNIRKISIVDKKG